jgi:hypothetical protein
MGVRLVALYRKGHTLRAFKISVLRRIFRRKREKVNRRLKKSA